MEEVVVCVGKMAAEGRKDITITEALTVLFLG